MRVSSWSCTKNTTDPTGGAYSASQDPLVAIDPTGGAYSASQDPLLPLTPLGERFPRPPSWINESLFAARVESNLLWNSLVTGLPSDANR